MAIPKPAHSDFWLELATDLGQREAAGLKRQLALSLPGSPRMIQRDGRSLVHFGSNDYLSLAWHPEVREAFQRAAQEPRVGAVASPLITGAASAYKTLTETLALWEQTEAAMVFSSGYAANVGTVAALASKGDAILSDALNHACLIDGCRLARAEVHVYPHADMTGLEDLLRTVRPRHRRIFVVTDTVFSMDGDIAPVREIQDLCKQFDAMAIADEAHASGVLGERGRGVACGPDIDASRWIRTGTLSKAIGCSGGFVTGPKVLIEWLTQSARSWIYSTAAPSALLAAAARSIEILSEMDAQREGLAVRSRTLREGLTALGFTTRADLTPIVPIYFQSPDEVLSIAKHLSEAGFFVPAIRPPTVPRGTAMLRISLTAAHTDADVGGLLEALKKL
ncbi:MAG: aminotransferase class I/II-fold pyridoxal phosphate-dependent enzyme [Planctomycetota bacterium]